MSQEGVATVPSVLWRCWWSGRKGIGSVKTECWGTCVVVSLVRDADMHMAQVMLLPLTVFRFTKIHIRFTFCNTFDDNNCSVSSGFVRFRGKGLPPVERASVERRQ